MFRIKFKYDEKFGRWIFSQSVICGLTDGFNVVIMNSFPIICSCDNRNPHPGTDNIQSIIVKLIRNAPGSEFVVGEKERCIKFAVDIETFIFDFRIGKSMRQFVIRFAEHQL